MVELLASHTHMVAQQAIDGMPIEPEHLYVIPPGFNLSVKRGRLHLSRIEPKRGARLPFDYLLQSVAGEYGRRAIAIVLSGTGADGSQGLKAIKQQGGLVIAQDSAEAASPGMPESAIATGLVDLAMPVDKMWQALMDRKEQLAEEQTEERGEDLLWLRSIIDILRAKAAHDFTLYKTGTLYRRIERRMSLAGIEVQDRNRYVDLLKKDAREVSELAQEILINVTSFFRDPKVFEFLAEKIFPDLVRQHPADRPFRMWTAGCSTGEETYSLAMLFREACIAADRQIKLQIFASDVDPEAIANAREGLYPPAIETEVSPDRLKRFFDKEGESYRVTSELRGSVVFTVQDVLADPPFSRLDFVSCRNLLIYLRPEAQSRVIGLFDFALRDGGTLLLGSSETISNPGGRFEVISKPARLYRHMGIGKLSEIDLPMTSGEGLRVPSRVGAPPSRQGLLADLSRRLVMETYAPAAVLIDRKYQCLYSLGPTERYLRVAPGHPTHDLLSMARENIRIKLRVAIQQASQENSRVRVTGGLVEADSRPFSIEIQPVKHEGEDLLLVCFIDAVDGTLNPIAPTLPEDISKVAALEHELAATRAELQGAIRNLQLSNEEQKAINEEALSVNEEYQSANEELLTSKEELQSLNEELTVLNSQLQETLDRQRTTANDLQNVLYSTDVATLFLDADFRIRFFTPATQALFNILPSDIGRPISDLNLLTAETDLISDAQHVLETQRPFLREIDLRTGIYCRRILPYRTEGNNVDGIVITLEDITERRQTADALEVAKRQAELATVAKSRFLAAASHDLRQPLQTLALLQGLLAKTVEGERLEKLVTRLDEALKAMSGMLNTLLDINQIEAGTVKAELVNFSIADLLNRLRNEFSYHAQAQGLSLSVVSSDVVIRSDPQLLEQILRNLLSNALKYTKQGKVLVGCRRDGDQLTIEIWDTGIGIPPEELQAIFEEYHQLDNASHDPIRGLGLGLSIVQRLGHLLGHRLHVRSHPGKGSVFTVQVQIPDDRTTIASPEQDAGAITLPSLQKGRILIVDDDQDIRELLALLLQNEGHRVAAVGDGLAALDLIAQGRFQPDLIITDYNLPDDLDGLEVGAKIRESLRRKVPVIVLTGDISTETLRAIALQKYVQLNKPVNLPALTLAIARLLPAAEPAERTAGHPVIFVVDDDSHIRAIIRSVLEEVGHRVEDYASCEAFLDAYRPGREACLLVDANFQGMSGLELLQRLQEKGQLLPSIMITGHSDVAMAVQAMKAGASDFIEKPLQIGELLAGVERALSQARDANKQLIWHETAASHIAALSEREREVLDLVLSGHPSKNIAADLGISQRTVENHRAAIMKKTGTKSLPALARLALAARGNEV